MPSNPKRFTLPIVLAAGLAAFAISACGGSDDSGSTQLAKYAPADTPIYVEGAVQPESEVAADVDAISEKLAGANLGELIKDGINSSGQVDFEADVQPWLGEDAAAFGEFDPTALAPDSEDLLDAPEIGELSAGPADSAEEKFGLIVETTDPDAARDFIDKRAAKEGGATDGEYEGYSYKVDSGDGATVGIVDDYVVAGSSEAEFKAAVDASKGDSLADTDTFSELSGKVTDGALATIFTSNDPYVDSLKEGGFDLSGLASALGIDLEGTGSVISLVPNENEISLQGYSNAGSDLESGDPSPVLQSFPADSLFATGTGDFGTNVTKILEALNQEGIPGLLEPGEVDRMIEQSSGQIDAKGIIESLETVALFVNGTSEQNLGGALVATSSNIDPIESSLRSISSLIGLAEDARVRPLPGQVAGFRVNTAELPGRPIVVGVNEDRLVIGVGMKASMTALTGAGRTLGDTPAYQAAENSIAGEGLDLFASPGSIARLVAAESTSPRETRQIVDAIRKFEYLGAGSGEGDNSFEFNLGLRE